MPPVRVVEPFDVVQQRQPGRVLGREALLREQFAFQGGEE